MLIPEAERRRPVLMGWSQAAMAKRYQHITAALRDDIAGRLGGFLWRTN